MLLSRDVRLTLWLANNYIDQSYHGFLKHPALLDTQIEPGLDIKGDFKEKTGVQMIN